MQQGTVARIIADKGFGFITREGEEKDLFFHRNEVPNEQFENLREGDTVSFEVQDGDKGPSAVQVTKA
ncbi:MAG: cold shock domain-containing protein [Candidatus Pacebacteria bacterium]|nr:cold shock domain-containing protein [Candidatus Paceibacterota bacterium]